MAQWITIMVKHMLRFEPLYGNFLFVRIPVNAVQRNFSLLRTAKIHRIQR